MPSRSSKPTHSPASHRWNTWSSVKFAVRGLPLRIYMTRDLCFNSIESLENGAFAGLTHLAYFPSRGTLSSSPSSSAFTQGHPLKRNHSHSERRVFRSCIIDISGTKQLPQLGISPLCVILNQPLNSNSIKCLEQETFTGLKVLASLQSISALLTASKCIKT